MGQIRKRPNEERFLRTGGPGRGVSVPARTVIRKQGGGGGRESKNEKSIKRGVTVTFCKPKVQILGTPKRKRGCRRESEFS